MVSFWALLVYSWANAQQIEDPTTQSPYLLPLSQAVAAITIEFYEADKVRIRNGKLESLSEEEEDYEAATSTPMEVDDVNKHLSDIFNLVKDKDLKITRSISDIDEAQLDQWYQSGKNRGKKDETANLNSFYRVPLSRETKFEDIESLVLEITNNPVVKQEVAPEIRTG